MPARELEARFRKFVEEHALLEAGQRLIVGVSGGVDSMVLWHLLRTVADPLAVHVNHGLRADAGQDAAFVQQIGARWQAPVRVVEVNVPEGASPQAQARRARYAALEEVALAEALSRIAVAHQRDDVAETLLLQLLRGAGPRGWAALPVERPLRRSGDVHLIRPLRFASRLEIEGYARAHDLLWREDPSNSALVYRRAVVRRRIIPLLEKYFGEDVSSRLASAAELAEAYRDSGAPLNAVDFLDEVRAVPGALDVEVLRRLAPVARQGVILEALAEFDSEAPRSAAAAAAVSSLIDAQPGRRVELGPVVVWREREVLQFTRPHQPLRFAGTLSVPGTLHTIHGRLEARLLGEVPHQLPVDPHVEILDADRIAPELMVRTWKAGDVLRPLGLGGRKRVSDLLTDRRVPSSDRERQLVVMSGDEIVWVVGHRLAEQVAVTPATTRAVRLRWIPAEPEG